MNGPVAKPGPETGPWLGEGPDDGPGPGPEVGPWGRGRVTLGAVTAREESGAEGIRDVLSRERSVEMLGSAKTGTVKGERSERGDVPWWAPGAEGGGGWGSGCLGEPPDGGDWAECVDISEDEKDLPAWGTKNDLVSPRKGLGELEEDRCSLGSGEVRRSDGSVSAKVNLPDLKLGKEKMLEYSCVNIS